MATGRTTVERLALEADTDIDDVLVRLWDVGFEYLVGPQSAVRQHEVSRARRVLGLATRRDVESRDYWKTVFGLDDEGFEELARRLDIKLQSGSARLPKNSASKLKMELRRTQARSPQVAPPDRDTRVGDQLDASGPFEWTTVGQYTIHTYLSVDEVRRIHVGLEEEFRGSNDQIEPPGVRSEDLLESAVFRAHTSSGPELKYPTVEMAGAALLHSIVHNHPFFNGNKRTALIAMLTFLNTNGVWFGASNAVDQDEVFRMMIRIANHRLVPSDADFRDDREVLEIAKWIHGDTRRVERGERPLAWRRLRKILTSFGCDLSFPGGTGNRINIRRTVEGREFFRLRATRRELSTQVAYQNEGSVVERNTMNKIRRDLELDDAHGVDSARFYGGDVPIANDLISAYQPTLRRLARV